MSTGGDPVLEVRDLSVGFRTGRGTVRALRHVDLQVPRNRMVGIVGESGRGKSTLINAVLRLLAPNAAIGEGSSVRFQGEDVLAMGREQLRALRGQRISMVFQDPMTALNPVVSIGTQMTDILIPARPAHGSEAAARDGDAEPGGHPRRGAAARRLSPSVLGRLELEGEIPSLMQRPRGCEFHTRCPFVQNRCRERAPEYREVAAGRWASCHFPFPESS